MKLNLLSIILQFYFLWQSAWTPRIWTFLMLNIILKFYDSPLEHLSEIKNTITGVFCFFLMFILTVLCWRSAWTTKLNVKRTKPYPNPWKYEAWKSGLHPNPWKYETWKVVYIPMIGNMRLEKSGLFPNAWKYETWKVVYIPMLENMRLEKVVYIPILGNMRLEKWFISESLEIWDLKSGLYPNAWK